MPRVTKTGPPGSANAFTEASSTTWNCQGRLGRLVCLARLCPRRFTYASSFGSLTVPIVCSTSWAACLPISISWLSETMSSCSFPVAGLRTQLNRSAATAAQTPGPRGPATERDAAAGEAPPLLQLPRDVKPVRYSISMEIDPQKTRFRGSVDISVELSRPRSAIWLHGRNLHVSVASVSGISATFEQVNPEGLARLSLARPAGAGPATIHLEWDAAFDRQIVGLYPAHE